MKKDIHTLKKRQDFLKIAKDGRKWVCPFFIVQTLETKHLPHNPENKLIYGVTASKKVGSAVKRNSAKRRMRALVANVMAEKAKINQAYVMVARDKMHEASYVELEKNLLWCLKKLDALEG